jgi:hypothetical protein
MQCMHVTRGCCPALLMMIVVAQHCTQCRTVTVQQCNARGKLLLVHRERADCAPTSFRQFLSSKYVSK